MKTNKDGQGVMPGVLTDKETDKKKYEAEKRRFAGIFTDTCKMFSEYISIIHREQTYRSVQILEVALAVMRGMKACASKAGHTGTIRVTVRPNLEKTKVEVSYTTVLFEGDEPAGKSINKKELYGGGDVFTSIDCDDFDERQSRK